MFVNVPNLTTLLVQTWVRQIVCFHLLTESLIAFPAVHRLCSSQLHHRSPDLPGSTTCQMT